MKDNNSLQRSVQTGATAGSDAAMASLALFSDDESGDSTGQEEDESDAGETDEQDTEEFAFSDEQLERRNAATVPATAAPPVRGSTSLAPQSMMWAIRHRENSAARSGGAANGAVINSANTVTSSTANLMYLEPSSLRRSAAAAAAAAATAAVPVVPEPFSMATTASGLARAFGLVIRQISDLLTMLLDYPALAPALTRNLEITSQESIHLQQFLEYRLKPVWDWLVNVMDSTEAQLRFGVALSSASAPFGSPSNHLSLFGRVPPSR